MESDHNQQTLRKQLRLPNYDYSQNGAYYVTICTYNRAKLFGSIQYVGAHPCVRPGAAGVMIEEKLSALESKFDNVRIDYHCIMPDHVHMIVWITHPEGGHTGPPLHSIIRWFKTQTTNEYIKLVKSGILPPFDKHIWQRNYFEHVIRGEADLYEIRKYIDDNPAKWFFEKHFQIKD